MSSQVSAIREFNRFYTAKLGLLRRNHLEGKFSLTESRTLFEIGLQPSVTARQIRHQLSLDAGYMSRVLSTLTKSGLIHQTKSKGDGREKHLQLTDAGRQYFDYLDTKSASQIETLLEQLSSGDRRKLETSFATIREILGKEPIEILKLEHLDDQAIELLYEYYDAVNVVVRDSPDTLRAFVDDPSSGFWVAFRGEKPVGCVALRTLPERQNSGECKRLYVRPDARGLGVADKLMDALEAYARAKTMEWIYLDTYDDLVAAISLYQKRGYESCSRYNDNPQATQFLRKRLTSPHRHQD